LLGVSLRLGGETTYFQPLGRMVTTPTFSPYSAGAGDDTLLAFDWGDAEGDYGYPLELSSSVYRRGELVDLVERIVFDGPTLLEHGLWLERQTLAPRRPRLATYALPRAFSAALNRVQTLAPNPVSGHERHTAHALLDAFHRGWRIDVAAYDGFRPRSCHVEVDLLLRRLGSDEAIAS
jgi:hypothetical protein